MKMKAICALLVIVMAAGILAGCGSKGAAGQGRILNIQCWNEEFKSRLADHYPGYEVIDGTTGKIGDVIVKWTITPSDDNAYQNHLDDMLLRQKDLPRKRNRRTRTRGNE